MGRSWDDLKIFFWSITFRLIIQNHLWCLLMMYSSSIYPTRAVLPLGVSGPHWKKKSCLGPHIKYTNTKENWWAKKKKVLSKFTTLCWATFLVILGCMRPAGWTLRHSHKLTQAPCLIRQKREEIIVGSETAPVVTGNWISVQQPQYLSLAKKKIRAKNQTIRESLLGKSQR